jgi:K+-sensing histidine kinase KdpD
MLLAHVQAQERRARVASCASTSARLPGGKTYAMLTAARKLIADGVKY